MSRTKLGQGFYWQDLAEGMRFETFRRTITESDLVNFTSVTGMLESIFIDATFQDWAMRGRPVPGAITYTLIEGLLLQSMTQGTGLALLEMNQKLLLPVVVGDTIHAQVEISNVRPTSRSGRGVVAARNDVFDQRGEQVMTYTATRLLAGRPAG